MLYNFNKMSEISLLELIFSGDVLNNIGVGVVLSMGAVITYLFFCKYFDLKEVVQKEDDFLANIADCIYDQRIEAARDLCKREGTPEARIIRKGIKRIEGSVYEVFVAVNSQREIEVLELRKNLFRFGLFAKIMMVLGLFMTLVSLVSFFLEGQWEINQVGFYTAFVPMGLGLFFGMLICIFEVKLKSLMEKIELNLAEKSKKFLEIVAEIK